MKRIVLWTTTFSLLGLFTVATLINTFSAPAYAASLNSEKHLQKHYLECDRDEHFVRTDMLCALSDHQLALLVSHYRVSTRVIRVHGHKVSLISVSGRHVTQKKLAALLGPLTTADGGKCIIVKRSHSFFFLLAPQIS